jgi:uncharacterized membrane protein
VSETRHLTQPNLAPRHSFKANSRLALALAGACLFSAPAAAELKLCNATPSRIGIAIGYQDPEGWSTAQTCETLLKGNLPSRFVYIHAVDYDRNGEWAGSNLMCTAEKSFAIRGVQDCPKRGYKKSGFFEVDTGDAKEWTVRLTDPTEAPAKPK